MEVEDRPKLKTKDFLLPGEQLLYPEVQKCKVNRTHFTFSNNKVISRFSGLTTVKEQEQKTSISLLRMPLKYSPSVGDNVIGVIRSKDGDNYYLDINTSSEGSLGQLQFNGATKRNKPNLQLGDVVLCHITEGVKYLSPKLSCMSNNDKDWTSGETKYGLLKPDGNLLIINPYRYKYVQELCEKMGKQINFQIVFGKNGVVYVSTKMTKNLILISNLLEKANKQNVDSILSNLHDLVEK